MASADIMPAAVDPATMPPASKPIAPITLVTATGAKKAKGTASASAAKGTMPLRVVMSALTRAGVVLHSHISV